MRCFRSSFVAFCAIFSSLFFAACASRPDGASPVSSLPVDSSVPPFSAATSSSSSFVSRTYADGTYSAVGNYVSPAGDESVDISLTLKGGLITQATFKGNALGKRSMEMQKQFSEGYTEQVVGRSIDSLALTVVNGSSLTSRGFMDAVEKIKSQALVS